MDEHVKDKLNSQWDDSLEELASNLDLLASRAYRYADEDPSSSMLNARKVAEAICDYLILKNALVDELRIPEELKGKIDLLRKNKKLPHLLEAHASTLLIWGNFGAHYRNQEPNVKNIDTTLNSMRELTNWFFEEYGLDRLPKTYSSLKPFSHAGSTDIARLPLETVPFMAQIQQNPQNIQGVGMAFHVGAEWRSEPEKVSLLQFILENRIPLRVMLNEEKTVRKICEHMRQKGKRYVGFRQCIKEWSELQAEYGDFIQVRICNLPLIHRIYLLQNKDDSGAVNVKYYTYGNSIPAKDHRSSFLSGTPEYNLYTDEFEYLWENSVPPTL